MQAVLMNRLNASPSSSSGLLDMNMLLTIVNFNEYLCNQIKEIFTNDKDFRKKMKLMDLYQRAVNDLSLATEDSEKKTLKYLIAIILCNYRCNDRIKFYSKLLQAKRELKDSIKNILNLYACSKETKEFMPKEIQGYKFERIIKYLVNRQKVTYFQDTTIHYVRPYLRFSHGYDDEDQDNLKDALGRFFDLIQR